MKNTNTKYISKCNFYKMTQTHAYACTWIIYDEIDVCRGAGKNLRWFFFIVFLFLPSLRQNVHLLTYLVIFLHFSFRFFRSRSRKPTFRG